MTDDRRYGCVVPVLLVAVFWLAASFLSGGAFAQTPNPVTPGYQICNTNDPGNTHCSFVPNGGSAVTNCSGTVATGGTAQPLFTAAQYHIGFVVEVGANDSNTDALYFSDGPTTTTPTAGDGKSLSLAPSTATAPGGSFTAPSTFPANVAYFINGATTGDKYKCRVW